MAYQKKTHCKNGHEFTEENIYTNEGSTTRYCIACRLASVNAYTHRNRDKINEGKRQRRARRTKTERREDNLRQLGWTLGSFDQAVKKQKGLCEICGNKVTFEDKISRTRACADHCHITGKPRGVLCSNCNIGIGNLQDSVRVVESALAYLKKYD